MWDRYKSLVEHATLLFLIMVNITACNSDSADPKLKRTNVTELQKLDLSFSAPTSSTSTINGDSASMVVATSQPLNLIARNTDGSEIKVSSASWQVADESVLSISNGLITAKSPGRTTIKAKWNNKLSNSIKVVVNKAQLQKIQLLPTSENLLQGNKILMKIGITETFLVNAIYNNGKVEDVTSEVSFHWSGSVLEHLGSGKIQAKIEKTTDLSASYIYEAQSVDSNTITVEVTDAPLEKLEFIPSSNKVPVGVKIPLKVEGTFADSSKQDVTNSVTWISSDDTVALVNRGVVEGLNAGTVDITASLNGKSATKTLHFTSATLQSILVQSTTPQLPVGLSHTLKAMGSYSDGTSLDITQDVTWKSSDTSIVAISDNKFTAKAQGAINITASMQNIHSGVLSITVTPQILQSFEIKASNSSIAAGHSLSFTAEAIYSDQSRVDVTSQVSWSVLDTSIAVIDPSGTLTSSTAGITTVKGTYKGMQDAYSLNVTTAVLEKLEILDSNVKLYRALGQTHLFKAKAIYSDGVEDVGQSSSYKWFSNVQHIQISSNGEAHAISAGAAHITVSYKDVTSVPVTVTVDDSDVVSIEVTPRNLSSLVGDYKPLKVEVELADGQKMDASRNPSFFQANVWQIDDTNIARASRSLVVAMSAGNTLIQAKFTSPVTQQETLSNQITFTSQLLPVCGGTINDVDQSNAAGACLKIAEVNGKKFTNTPSKALLDLIGGFSQSTAPLPTQRNYHSIQTEDGSKGPTGEAAAFTSTQGYIFCGMLNQLKFYNSSNWVFASKTQLEELNSAGDMYTRFGWPTASAYWTRTMTSGGNYTTIDLGSPFAIGDAPTSDGNYVSCVSE